MRLAHIGKKVSSKRSRGKMVGAVFNGDSYVTRQQTTDRLTESLTLLIHPNLHPPLDLILFSILYPASPHIILSFHLPLLHTPKTSFLIFILLLSVNCERKKEL